MSTEDSAYKRSIQHGMERVNGLEPPLSKAIQDAITTVVRRALSVGTLHSISDAVMVADVILASMPEASTDTRDFFADAPTLLADILGKQPRIPDCHPPLTSPPNLRNVIAQGLIDELSSSSSIQLPSHSEADQILRAYFSVGQWAELEITIRVTRKDVSRIETRKAQQVYSLLNFVTNVMTELSKPTLNHAPLEPGKFRLVGERAA